jgi:hypothetical protein
MSYRHAHSSDLYDAIRKTSKEYDISAKEVEETILRWYYRKVGGMPRDCKHKHISARRDKTRPHCTDCWTWMQMLVRPNEDFKGKFIPIPSKLETDLNVFIILKEDLR